jgi:hypothetical protein
MKNIKQSLNQELSAVKTSERVLKEITDTPIRYKTTNMYLLSAGLVAAVLLSVASVFLFNRFAPDVELLDPLAGENDIVTTADNGVLAVSTAATVPYEPVAITEPPQTEDNIPVEPEPVVTTGARLITSIDAVTEPPVGNDDPIPTEPIPPTTTTPRATTTPRVTTTTEPPVETVAIEPEILPTRVIDDFHVFRIEIFEESGTIHYYSKVCALLMGFTYEVNGNVRGANMQYVSDEYNSITAAVFEEGKVVGAFASQSGAVPEGTLILVQRFTGSANSLSFREELVAYDNPAEETIVIEPFNPTSGWESLITVDTLPSSAGRDYREFVHLLTENGFSCITGTFWNENRIVSPNGHTSVITTISDGHVTIPSNPRGVWYRKGTLTVQLEGGKNEQLEEFMNEHFGAPIAGRWNFTSSK